MKILFLNDSSLITYGLSSGFQPTDEIRYLPVCRDNWDQQLMNLLQSWRPDFALADGVSISTVGYRLYQILHGYHQPFVYWAIDDPPDWRRMSLPLARGASLVLTPAQECVERYQKHGIKAKYFHFACNPLFHRPIEPLEDFSCDLLFVGNYYVSYPQRRIGIDTLLTPLLSSEYKLKVYGNEHWLKNTDSYILSPEVYRGYLSYTDLPKAYSSAKIVLGINSVVDSPTMMSMRIFEVLGCGAFLLTHWSPAIEKLFKNHVHLVWSHHPDETLELVRFYLNRDDLRHKIARKGQEEVYLNHTYQKRVREIRSTLETLRNPSLIIKGVRR